MEEAASEKQVQQQKAKAAVKAVKRAPSSRAGRRLPLVHQATAPFVPSRWRQRPSRWKRRHSRWRERSAAAPPPPAGLSCVPPQTAPLPVCRIWGLQTGRSRPLLPQLAEALPAQQQRPHRSRRRPQHLKKMTTTGLDVR